MLAVDLKRPVSAAFIEIEGFQNLSGGVTSVFLLGDGSEVVLSMDRPTLCSLADMVSQYATV